MSLTRRSSEAAAVALEGAPAWLDACMRHGGSATSVCSMLEASGAHHGPYRLALCECAGTEAAPLELSL